MSEEAGRYQRSAAGMVGAMIVLLAVVFAFVAFRSIVRDDLEPSVDDVDYAGAAELAQSRLTFEVLSPRRLPEGWRATSARHAEGPPQSWHLGVLTDEDRYVGLEQARRPVSAMVADYVDEEAVEQEPVTVDGETWSAYSDSGGDVALARREKGVTVLVVGTASQDELASFVRSLR